MPFDTYDNLKTAVIKQSKRTDLDLRFDDFLKITEVEIRSNPNAKLLLNLNENIATATALTTSRFLGLPDNFKGSRKFTVTLSEGIYKLTFVTPDQMQIRSQTGIPCFFTVRANQLEFDIIPDTGYTVTITYDSELTPLSITNQTNNVLTKYPNIYLYGCLKQAWLYSESYEEASAFDGLFSEALIAANMSEHDIKYPAQPQEQFNWAP